MLQLVRNLLFGRAEPSMGGGAPVTDPPQKPQQVETPNPYVLLSRRFDDYNEEDIPGFGEIYYCTRCRDEFVLAWHPPDSPLVQQCKRVPETHPRLKDQDLSLVRVFCPQCGSDYAMYGPIESPETIQEQSEAAEIYEALDYPFPPHVPSTPTGRLKLGKLVVERIVCFITGEFPAALKAEKSVSSAVGNLIEAEFGGDMSVSNRGGIRIHVLRTNKIVDETPWLMSVLSEHVYRTTTWTPRVLISHGIANLKSPLKECLLCLVLTDDSEV